METAIALDGATKRFGELTAVDGLSLEIGRGATVALLGANGAGKSTTVALLMGLLQPDAGTVTVAGLPPRRAVVEGRIAAMLQDSGLMPGVTAAELVGLGRRMYPAPLRVEEALELAGLRGLARRRVDRMSGGQVQRLKFALVAVAGADTMLLDEPTRALDVQGRREFWAAMRNCAAAGRTIVFATHYLDEVEENADRVVVLAGGRIAADGSPARIREAGGRAVVRFRIPAPASLPPLPGELVREHGWATVRSAAPDEVVRRLVASGAAWSDLRVSPPSLDDSFLALTGSDTGADPRSGSGSATGPGSAPGSGVGSGSDPRPRSTGDAGTDRDLDAAGHDFGPRSADAPDHADTATHRPTAAREAQVR